MPGKTRRHEAVPQTPGGGFNEAPAKCRGKLEGYLQFRDLAKTASMRPQRNAGENPPDPEPDEAEEEASMRPQRNAGENLKMEGIPVEAS